MLQHLAKTFNPRPFPAKHGGFQAEDLDRTSIARSKRNLILWIVILLSLLATNCRMTQKPETQTPPTTQNKADDPIAIHRRAIAIDMHADTPQRLLDEHVDLAQRLPDGHFDSVRATEGGLDAQFFSIW